MTVSVARSAKAHNQFVRLLHRNRVPSGSLEEGDCYERSYGAGVLGNVEVVHLEASEPRVDPEADGMHHVTSEGLKRQFVERLAARRRRR
jgi:hypothetical protein